MIGSASSLVGGDFDKGGFWIMEHDKLMSLRMTIATLVVLFCGNGLRLVVVVLVFDEC